MAVKGIIESLGDNFRPWLGPLNPKGFWGPPSLKKVFSFVSFSLGQAKKMKEIKFQHKVFYSVGTLLDTNYLYFSWLTF